MKPNWGDTDMDGILDCWDGYSNGGANQPTSGGSPGFYPIVLQIPDIVPLGDMSVQIDYAMASVSTGGGLNAPPLAGDGTIRIWKKDGFYARNGLIVLAGGDFVMPTTYTPQQLGFSDTNRTITLYVEAVAENVQKTRQLVELLGKPETTIKVSVDVANVGTFEDEVRYVVANTGSFYYELMMHPELLATYASAAVYSRANKPEFCLKVQNWAELEELGIPPEIISLLSTVHNDGFKAALYREYITGKYILAFAGTENPGFSSFNPYNPEFYIDLMNFTSLEAWADWLHGNIPQAFADIDMATQYQRASAIGEVLANEDDVYPDLKLNSSNTYITGHSLGGGLASAAALESGFHAYTFNAAGLHPACVTNHPNYGNAAYLATAYQVNWDILTWGQSAANWIKSLFGIQSDNIPEAVGKKVPLDSEYNLTVFVGGLLAFVPPYVVGDVIILRAGIKCHLMSQVIYGMEKRIFGN